MSVSKERMLLAIPMKDPSDAKTRLGVSLTQKQRGQLALSLFETVVERVQTVLQSMSPEQAQQRHIDIAVVSASPVLQDTAARLGILFFAEGPRSGLSQAVSHLASQAHAQGYSALCVLPGDLADPKLSDLRYLLSYPLDEQKVVICPSGDLGTNALMVPLPSPIDFGYGERSFHLHYHATIEAGMMPVVLPLTSLRMDVDTLVDLQYVPQFHLDAALLGDGR
ncbi:2-phospho-L-lactate guanylyltransferase [Cohaesibacter celericrescens]|uniref:2-phospho-L-lactate guanylyltransferase n=1 Tax=Cohaesibacter celericrescens TaxID=2067669 RepID=A0A2N5XUS1_9HYPH|nr:2-phospho-L-lactate guanylyltransferase [Cohaesibacter celericrescens]PLW78239.1 2-phospho-L-lactate guanylyltransferase [Cohaesibacter celericrescens]